MAFQRLTGNFDSGTFRIFVTRDPWLILCIATAAVVCSQTVDAVQGVHLEPKRNITFLKSAVLVPSLRRDAEHCSYSWCVENAVFS